MKKHSRPLTTERAPKAYKNLDFLNSKDARLLRILAEYVYPEQHFKRSQIYGTVVFFGSARIRSEEEYRTEHARLAAEIAAAQPSEKADLEHHLVRMEKRKPLTRYYTDAVELARLLTEWSLTVPESKRMLICSGGGPGIMEAANRGAYEAGGDSIGLNISLPFEQFPNPYITPELNFEFHYFFMRKFWFMNFAKALVVFPGGFGTMDEMFELLTLVQTKKITKELPIMLYGEQFWKNALNFQSLVDTGMISEEDLSLFKYADEPREAFEFLKTELTRIHNLHEA